MFQVSGVTVTPDSDQLVVIQLTDGNDLVLCLHSPTHEERVGELVGVLARFWTTYVHDRLLTQFEH